MKNLQSLLLVSIFATFSIFTSSANAEKLANSSDPFKLEIFSLSKKKENAFDSASSVYVLTTEDIRRSGATSIPEALRLVPGLQVARINGHSWAISSRGFNAQYSNKLLVMIDGRTVYTPLFSGTFWDVQDYLLEDIEKIEVIRGSGGTIWGSNAVNGIINIITKNAAATNGAYASAIIGTEDRAIWEARYGGKTEKNDHYRIYAKQVHRDELSRFSDKGDHISSNDGYRNSQAGFRYDVSSIRNNKVSIHGDIRQGRSENYFDAQAALRSGTGSFNHRDTKGANIGTNWDKTISRKSSISLNTYIDYDQFDINRMLSRSSKTFDVDFQHYYDFNRENQLIWGAGYRLIKDAITDDALTSGSFAGSKALDYTPDKRNDEILSAFIQDKIGLVPDKLYLTLGTKFEHNDYTGGEFQPNAKLTYFPSRNQTIWASVSQAVRTPTRGEDGLKSIDGRKGNAEYRAEKVITYETGYRVKPSRKLLLDISTFYSDYSELRTFETGSNVSNKGHGRTYGGEVSAKWYATNDWLLEAGYDFIKMDLEVSAGSIDAASMSHIAGQSPNNQFRLRSNYNITRNIEFDNILYYVDSLPDARTTSGSGLEQNGIPSYVRFDTRIGYLPSENWEISLVGQNLTDHRHQEFSKGFVFGNRVEVGRSFYLKTVWQY